MQHNIPGRVAIPSIITAAIIAPNTNDISVNQGIKRYVEILI